MRQNLLGQNKALHHFLKLGTYICLIAMLSMGTGCTSSDNKEQSSDSSSEAGDGLDSAELADDGSSNPDSVESGDAAASAAPAEDGDIVADLGDDPTNEQAADLPDQPLGEEALAAPAEDVAQAPTEEAPPADAPPAEPAMDMAANDVPPPTEEAPPVDTGYSEEAPAAPKASLKKIKDTPFTSNGRILNTVYLARKGDTLKSVSNKLFGTNKTRELKADNPILSRGVKPGDKIYYNSPRRPDDSSTMMTYYEDKGIPSQSYVAQEGDNIRAVSKNLLGFPEAWKEIWSTNASVESKGELTAGTELKYWPPGADEGAPAATPAPEQTMAQAPPPPQEMAPPPPAMDMPPPPPMETAQLPPPPPDVPAAGTMDSLPPPPPPPAGKKKDGGSSPFMIEDEQTTMAIGIGIITFLTAILLTSLILKKGRAKKMKLGQTQV